MIDQSSSESIIHLVNELSARLTKLFVSQDINEFSLIRKDFTKKSTFFLWDLFIFDKTK